jgi:hypothetical protein
MFGGEQPPNMVVSPAQNASSNHHAYKRGNKMTAVELVEKEIEKFPKKELTEFRRWFEKYDSDAWDAQIEADAAAGKLDALAEEAIAEYNAGKAREI